MIYLVENDGTVTDALPETDIGTDTDAIQDAIGSSLRNFQTAEIDTINSSELLSRVSDINDNIVVSNTITILILAFCFAFATFIMLKK